MGLDMYLYGSRFISSYDPLPEEAVLVEAIREGMDLPDCENPLSTFETKILQWRKANAIHKWFVDNCQDGKDECQRTSLMLSDLHALRDTLAQLLNHDESKAALLLPPTSGFFFGSEALDEWYWDEVDRTHAILDEWIKYIETDRERAGSWGWDLFYDSSW